MIFITTGSRSFQFNRLLAAVDEAVGSGLVPPDVFAQVGGSDYCIANYESVPFLDFEDFQSHMKQAEIVLTHGGTGALVSALKMGKKVVAIPRLAEFGEAVDNHQVEIIAVFEKMGYVTPCYDCSAEGIALAIKLAREKKAVTYVSNTEQIIDSIDEMIQRNIKKTRHGNCPSTSVLMCGSDRSEKGGMNTVIEQMMEHCWCQDVRLSYLPTHISGGIIGKSVFFAKAYLRLNRMIHSNTFDTVHLHMSYKGSFYRKYMIAKKCKRCNKKVILHLHGSEFKTFYRTGNGYRKRCIRELLSISDCVITLGDAWREFVLSVCPEAKVVVIYNSVKIPEIRKEKKNDRSELVFLGALIERKGVSDLLKALVKLMDEGVTDFHLTIAGEGSEAGELKDFVHNNHLNQTVDFAGWITGEEKQALFKNADMMILPSYNEGLPIAILEALSYGVPVISTNVGSISEAVIDGVNGYLFEPGDIEHLAMLIKGMVGDKKNTLKLSENARAIAEERFSEDNFFEVIENLYLQL